MLVPEDDRTAQNSPTFARKHGTPRALCNQHSKLSMLNCYVKVSSALASICNGLLAESLAMIQTVLAIPLALGIAACSMAQSSTSTPTVEEPALMRLARQIEPGLVGQPVRLPQYLNYFRLKLGNDTRLFAFDVTAETTDDGRVLLYGYVEFPETRQALIGFLEHLGFMVQDDALSTLPSKELRTKAFGLVKTTHTLSYDSPSKPRSVVTDCLLGEPLYLLREEQGHLLVHSREGYLGYVAASDVHRVGAAAFCRYLTEKSVRMIAEYRLDSGLVIPAGAQLKRLPSKTEEVVCALPTGEVIELPSNTCESTKQSDAQIERAIASGRQLLETPYLWGGKTSEGIDCSGLVQVAFATTGVHLPRDSNQQFLLGQLTATRWYRQGMRRGDTLYFLGENGRIRHTALYLGGDRYLQAEMPAVEISSFNAEHDDYDARRDASFAFAKRLLE